jgi:2-polyprenyl-6-methoxyphenol hydroxylase-like FAD-dependent oxidoreductase
VRALVAGGGVGGLVAGLALRQAGIEPAVFEQRSLVSAVHPSSAVIVQQNAMRVFQRLGVADRLVPLGTTLERLEHRTSGGRLIAAWDLAHISEEAGAPTFTIRRTALLEVLAAALGEALRGGARVTAVSQDGDGVKATIADRGEERADLLVGADGVASTVRAAVFGDQPPRFAGYAIWEGIARLAPSPPGLQRMIWGSGRRIVIYPVGQDEVYWYAIARARRGEGDGLPAKLALLDRFRGWMEPVERVLAATDEDAISRVYDFDRYPAGPRVKGRVVLLGEAAHPMTVSIPQGIAQAAEDAFVLAESLRAAATIEDGLTGYEERRRTRPVRIAMLARGYGMAARAPGDPEHRRPQDAPRRHDLRLRPAPGG